MSQPRIRLVASPTNLDRLIATVETLESIAETASDTQAALVDPVEAAWLNGYRQACKDVHAAHTLHAQAYPERTTP